MLGDIPVRVSMSKTRSCEISKECKVHESRVASRYIWLPMWVREIPGVDGTDAMAASQRIQRRQRYRSMRHGKSSVSLTIPPIDVAVRCCPGPLFGLVKYQPVSGLMQHQPFS